VHVLASSATLSDSVVRRGFSPYLQHLELPFTLGYDFVGRIEFVGAGVFGLRPGDLVADITRYGANADFVVRPAASLTALPPDIDPVAVEPLVMSAMTALQMLTRVARLSPGESVLVVGASGSVGLSAVALARRLGAAVVLGTASTAKRALLLAQGAVPFDREADLAAAVRREVPRGVDVIIDAVGGSAIAGLGALLAPGGRLVSFGLSALARGGPRKTPEALARLGDALGQGRAAMTALNATGDRFAGDYDVTTVREQHRDWYDADLNWLLQQARSGAFQTAFEARPLEHAIAAHADIDEGRVRGRLVFDHRPRATTATAATAATTATTAGSRS
jgi:NADPH2:quinone reductase